MNGISIILYFLINSIVIVLFSCRVEHGENSLVYNKQKKPSIFILIVAAILYTLLNYICTIMCDEVNGTNGTIYGYDRYNYYLDFKGRNSSTKGLVSIFNFVKLFTNDFNIVLYITSFLCCLIVFISYRISEERSVAALVFFLLTDIVFSFFIHLKQCYVNSIFALIIVLSMGKNTIVKDIFCLFLIYIGLQFHAIAIVLLPIFILIRFNRWQNKFFIVISLAVVVLFLLVKPIAVYVAGRIQSIYPYGANKIMEYFSSNTKHESSMFAFIKGLPLYLITLFGLLKRHDLKAIYNNYDNYLFLSIIGSAFYLLSIVSYWLYRATMLFYFPISILFGIIYNELRTKEKTVFITLTVMPQMVIFIRWLILMVINYGVL